jgi:hypothetical protein
MDLKMNGQSCPFITVREFRARYNLPPEFGIRLFAPKDYAGLGSIDRAGEALQVLQEVILASLPHRSPSSWMGLAVELQQVFHHQLWAINPSVGLKRSEIEYAVVGFGEVIQTFIHGLITAYMTNRPFPVFEAVYAEWINRTTQVIQRTFLYSYQGKSWVIRLVMHAYGRIGLVVNTGDQTFCVYDGKLACPAEGFMFMLLQAVTQKLAVLAENTALEARDGA